MTHLTDPLTLFAGLSLLIWLHLVFFRGRFWRADQRLAAPGDPARRRPPVVAVVPARDEADVIGPAVAGLLLQDYPGEVRVVVVDDRSEDGTAAAARRAAEGIGAADRLTVVDGRPLPPGWVGKTWAMAQGVERAEEILPEATYVWFTDADVVHGPKTLAALVAKAEDEDLALVSLMVRLHCRDGWERLLIPAFVYFFQKLYPFPLVNDRRRRLAGAAGGCVLVNRAALRRAGGIERIRGELIDDCALGRALKSVGPIWLGLADESRCLRPYDGLGGIWRMVARSAYTQLGRSPLLLVLTLVGMVFAYLAPPLAAADGLLAGNPPAALIGAAAWMLMAFSYRPTLRLYGLSRWRALLLPVAGAFYSAMTLDSALRHLRGRGGAWKGRVYGEPARSR